TINKVAPFFKLKPTFLKFICAPVNNKNKAIKVLDPSTNNASVKLPILKMFGKSVLIIAPKRSGTIIIPPGNFSKFCLIFIQNLHQKVLETISLLTIILYD